MAVASYCWNQILSVSYSSNSPACRSIYLKSQKNGHTMPTEHNAHQTMTFWLSMVVDEILGGFKQLSNAQKRAPPHNMVR